MSRAKAPVRFKNVREAPCPACLDRNALNLVGRPIFVNGARLSSGCETCGGTGQVELQERIGDWPKGDGWAGTQKRKPPVPVALPEDLVRSFWV